MTHVPDQLGHALAPHLVCHFSTGRFCRHPTGQGHHKRCFAIKIKTLSFCNFHTPISQSISSPMNAVTEIITMIRISHEPHACVRMSNDPVPPPILLPMTNLALGVSNLSASPSSVAFVKKLQVDSNDIFKKGDTFASSPILLKGLHPPPKVI
jgi:hypothetical protein